MRALCVNSFHQAWVGGEEKMLSPKISNSQCPDALRAAVGGKRMDILEAVGTLTFHLEWMILYPVSEQRESLWVVASSPYFMFKKKMRGGRQRGKGCHLKIHFPSEWSRPGVGASVGVPLHHSTDSATGALVWCLWRAHQQEVDGTGLGSEAIRVGLGCPNQLLNCQPNVRAPPPL